MRSCSWVANSRVRVWCIMIRTKCHQTLAPPTANTTHSKRQMAMNWEPWCLRDSSSSSSVLRTSREGTQLVRGLRFRWVRLWVELSRVRNNFYKQCLWCDKEVIIEINNSRITNHNNCKLIKCHCLLQCSSHSSNSSSCPKMFSLSPSPTSQSPSRRSFIDTRNTNTNKCTCAKASQHHRQTTRLAPSQSTRRV